MKQVVRVTIRKLILIFQVTRINISDICPPKNKENNKTSVVLKTTASILPFSIIFLSAHYICVPSAWMYLPTVGTNYLFFNLLRTFAFSVILPLFFKLGDSFIHKMKGLSKPGQANVHLFSSLAVLFRTGMELLLLRNIS